MPATDITIVHEPIDALKPAPWNPRQISDDELAKLRRSLRDFGAVEPAIVNDRDGYLVGGHQRVKAAIAEGWRTFPVVHVDMDPDEAKMLNVALNRIAGEWDTAALSTLIADLADAGHDTESTGFVGDELDQLLASLDAPPDEEDRSYERGERGAMLVALAGIEDAEPPECHRGEVYALGVHRLAILDPHAPREWLPYWREDDALMPYPDVFLPIAMEQPCLFIQPNTRIAAYTLQAFEAAVAPAERVE